MLFNRARSPSRCLGRDFPPTKGARSPAAGRARRGGERRGRAAGRRPGPFRCPGSLGGPSAASTSPGRRVPLPGAGRARGRVLLGSRSMPGAGRNAALPALPLAHQFTARAQFTFPKAEPRRGPFPI